MKISNFINYFTKNVEATFVLEQSNVFNKIWKYDEFIKWHVFSTSDEYVVHIATFFQCVSLMTLLLK